MKKLLVICCAVVLLAACNQKNTNHSPEIVTMCNPMDISYRFALDDPSRREAADPTLIKYKNGFLLFASKSGGYWYSDDLTDWKLIETNEIPVEEYAPTAVVVGDTVYFLGSSNELSTIYKSTAPLSGSWSVAVPELEMPVWDPAFFLDDDNRLYLYWGCSDVNPLYGVEVDLENGFAFKSEPVVLFYVNTQEHGWEVPGDYNTLVNQSPWIEGPWVTKKFDKYYLQYSGPGTEFKSYSDGMYVSDNPLGPFTLQQHNPFAYKPEGFAAGAGHGSSFTDNFGNAWHIGTITISQKQIFERRLGLYPVFYDDNQQMFAITKYGDYPIIIPNEKVYRFDDLFPGWMLLSYNKPVSVSSSVDTLPAENMTDENIRTYWSAKTESNNEYVMMDLGELYDVYAIQINFAEHLTNIKGRQPNRFNKYIIESSANNQDWNILVDKSGNSTDNSHQYIQLQKPESARYLRIKNVEVPDGNFALSGFRVFGKGDGLKPGSISGFAVNRNSSDRRSVTLGWNNSDNATGYNISFGAGEKALYNNYMVYSDTTVTINTLNTNQPYWFIIEAFNENGITYSKDTLMVQ